MKTTLIASALIALSMAASGSAYAQRGDHGNERYDNDRNGRAEQRSNDRSDHDRNDRFKRNGRNDRYYNAQNFRRGQRLHREYRNNRYVFSDWRARRLSAPPRGHHWVRAGNDYVLAAIATGIIAQVLPSN